MPVDEFHLRNTARELADLYRQLHGLKHTHHAPPEVRVMKPAPGPQTPGNWLMVATYIDQEQRLRAFAFRAFSDIGVKLRDDDAAAPRLCELLAFHAQAVSELDWASDLLDELSNQARTINRRCNPPEVPTDLARRAQSHQQLFTASHAAKAASAATGKHIDRKHITYLGRAGHIPVHTDNQGKACYRLADVIGYLNEHDHQLGHAE